MWGLIIEGALLAGDFVYHRFMAPKPPPSKVGGAAVTLPRTDFGGPVPLVFGWTDVKSPFLAFFNVPHTQNNTDPSSGALIYRTYSVDMMFVVGIPMGKGYTHGARTTPSAPHLTRIWYGDKQLTTPTPGGLPFVNAGTFDGQTITQENILGGPGAGGGLIGAYYWFGGWTDQRFDFPATPIGDAMASKALASRSDAEMFGGLPNQMCVALTANLAAYASITNPDPNPTSIDTAIPSTGFVFGESPNVSAIRVEVATYGDVVSGVSQHIFAMNGTNDFGGDADPAEVIYCLYTDPFGKLAMDPSLIDLDSFGAASATLKSESFGYSRAFEAGMEGREMVQDVLRTIDAALGFNRTTGKLTLKLIRNDYDPATARQIDRTNCKALTNLSIGSATGVPNKIKVNYPDRSKGYAITPATAQNLANAVGQDGLVVESVLTFDGIKNGTIAQMVAERELAAVSRSLIKGTAVVDSSFRDMNVGDVIKLVWTDPDISGLIFRIAAIRVGAPTDPTIELDLIQDAFYVWGTRPPVDTGFGGHDASGSDGLSTSGG